jgi:hypothetical protein
MHLRLTTADRVKLERIAAQHGVSLSEAARWAIQNVDENFEPNGDSNDNAK